MTGFGRAFEWAVGCSIGRQTGAPVIPYFLWEY